MTSLERTSQVKILRVGAWRRLQFMQCGLNWETLRENATLHPAHAAHRLAMGCRRRPRCLSYWLSNWWLSHLSGRAIVALNCRFGIQTSNALTMHFLRLFNWAMPANIKGRGSRTYRPVLPRPCGHSFDLL